MSKITVYTADGDFLSCFSNDSRDETVALFNSIANARQGLYVANAPNGTVLIPITNILRIVVEDTSDTR